jgi:hypothetical protein
MNAKNARALAKEAVIPEIAKITEEIDHEARKGHTQLVITGVSQGGRAYLKDEGYEITEINYESAFSQVVIKW